MTFKTRSMVLMEFVKKFFLTFLIFRLYALRKLQKSKLILTGLQVKLSPRYMLVLWSQSSSADEEWEYQIA